MRFKPCIDIHNGRVKQIIGSSLRDEGDTAKDNFVSGQDGAFYGKLYREKGLQGGHIILLNPQSSPYYEEDIKQAKAALQAYPGGLQLGGGVTAQNAADFIKMGATHVIVTSYVFQDGKIEYRRLQELVEAVGKEHLVLDLSCRKKDGEYYIVTDRWQKFTDVKIEHKTLEKLKEYCDEFLIHAVDVEGKASGIEEELLNILAGWSGLPMTYAGGIRNMNDIEKIQNIGKGKIDFTVGSALDLFGGTLSFENITKKFS